MPAGSTLILKASGGKSNNPQVVNYCLEAGERANAIFWVTTIFDQLCLHKSVKN
jgi:hypothetical protein